MPKCANQPNLTKTRLSARPVAEAISLWGMSAHIAWISGRLERDIFSSGEVMRLRKCLACGNVQFFATSDAP